MSSILTWLRLDTKDFDAKLARSKRSVNNYQSSIASMAKTAGTGFLKFAGGIGIAVTASEGFMKTIRGSQELSDKFDNSINAAKSSVDTFFSSLATGDFSVFNKGLSDIISKAYAASAALDQLGNTRMAYNYFGTKTQAEIAEYQAVAADKTQDKGIRETAFNSWKTALSEKIIYSETMKEDVLNGLLASVVKGTVLDSTDITMSDFEGIIKIDLFDPSARAKEKEKLDKFYSQYEVKTKEIQKRRKSGGLIDWAFPESEEALERKEINNKLDNRQAKLNEEYKQAILYKQILGKLEDKELLRQLDLASEYHRVTTELATQEKTYNRMFSSFSKEKENKQTTKKEIIPEGSLKELDKKITDKKDEINLAVNQESKAKLRAELDELVRQRNEIDFDLNFPEGSISRINELLKQKRVEYELALDLSSRAKLQNEIDALTKQKRKIEIDVKYKIFNEKSPISDELKKQNEKMKQSSFPTLAKTKLQKIDTQIVDENDIDMNKAYSESLHYMGSAIGSVSSMFDSSAASVLGWGANLISTIGQVIPQITALMNVQQAETNTEVANAGAKVMSAHAGIPFVGVAMGIAGIASIIAAMANIPKFESGGIVPGMSLSGDKVLARLNSGEMVLNHQQQNNLFDIINSGRIGGANVTIGFDRVMGSDIYLSLKNYMNSTGKKL